jgi:hypothetical protein
MGDLNADTFRLLEKYFDAFVYVANWGARRFGYVFQGGDRVRNGPTHATGRHRVGAADRTPAISFELLH